MDTQHTTISNDSEQLSANIEHIHKLAAHLLPHYSEISDRFTLPEPHANASLQTLIGILHELHPADVAAVLENLPPKERVLVWRLAVPEEDGDVLLEVSDVVRESLIEAMNARELVAAVEDLDADDLAELADDLPRHVVDEALQTRDAEERAQVQAAMSYEDGQVGAVMNFEIVSIRADVTCEVVLRYLRRFDSLPDHTDKSLWWTITTFYKACCRYAGFWLPTPKTWWETSWQPTWSNSAPPTTWKKPPPHLNATTS